MKKTAKKVSKKKVAYKSVAKKNAVSKSQSRSSAACHLSVKLNDQTYDLYGDSISKCLETLKPIDVGTVKSKVVISALDKQSKMLAQRIVMPFEFKRLLLGSVNKELFEKRMILQMK